MTMMQRIVTLVCAFALVAGTGAGNVQAQAAGGPQEGIKVHGDWTIEVRSADGALIRREEFKNALADGGSLLAGFLARSRSAGYWRLIVFDRTTSPCQGGTAIFPNECHIIEAGGVGGQFSGTNVFPTLTASQLGVNGTQVRLQGSATALQAGVVSEVQSFLGFCGPQLPAGGCSSVSTAMPFTAASLPTPVPVAAGQIIQITFTVTFS